MIDRLLLEDFCRNNNPAAFEQLVSLHADLVYSSALRQTRDPHLAHDITQAVFVLLLKKAPSLGDKVILSAWLYRASIFVARDFKKREWRRVTRETEAFEMSHLKSDNKGPEWQKLMPALEKEMASLSEADRSALVLHYFEKKPFDQVGSAMGLSTDAAKKRVYRALERLRKLLLPHAANLSTALLAELLLDHSIQAAPAGVAAALSMATLQKLSAGSVAIAGTTTLMATLKTKIAIVSVAGILSTLLVSKWQLDRQQSESALQNSQLNSRLQAMAEENTKLQATMESMKYERDQLRKDHDELLRLRNQLSAVRKPATPPPSLSTNLAVVADTTTNPRILQFHGQTTATLGNGQTMVMGGWQSGKGRQILVFVSPSLNVPGMEGMVTLASRLVELPESVMGDVGLTKFADTSGELYGILTQQRTEEMFKSLEKMEGVDVLSAPRVSSLLGREAQISVRDDQEVDGRIEHLGPQLSFLPEPTADSAMIKLKVVSDINMLRKEQ